MIRVVLPHHLRTLAGVTGEIGLEPAEGTQQGVIDALESAYPPLTGTIRDPATQRRRPFIRFFADEEDLSHEAPHAPLPEAVLNGAAAYYVVGAMAGG